MIYHDRMTVLCRTKATSSAPVTETFNGSVPAIVQPLAALEASSAGLPVTISRWQLFLKPFAFDIPQNASSNAPSSGGSNQILFTYNGRDLILEGRIERHTARGRLHHYEALVRSL